MSGAAARPITEIVLVGGGHSHVEVIRRFAMSPEPATRLTVIARDVDTPYSGMVPGYFAGHYTRGECHIDLRPLAVRAGARLYHAAATGIDTVRRLVMCAGRPPVRYDLVSLDIGSTPDASAIAGAGRYAIAVKPIDGLFAAVEAIDVELSAGRDSIHIAVVGAGAGGVELTLALHHRFSRVLAERGRPVAGLRFTIMDMAATIVPALARGARRALVRAIGRRGIEVRLGAPVCAIEEGRVVVDGGPSVACDRAILVSGAGAPAWIGGSGLATDARGFLKVDRYLRSVSHPQVFAAGDVASFEPRALPKSGVYAVRAGPVLATNLRRAAQGKALVPFRPQRHTLALVSTGPKHAVAARGPFAVEGRAMWRLKDRIDRRFMEKYANLPAMPARPIAGGSGDILEEMRCGGCGAKIDRAVLSRALARLPVAAGEGVLAGLDAPDDAAVLMPPADGEVVVQTVDQFRAFIDDPWLFGRITAVHCLGDLYAMGARPTAGLALVMLPHGHGAAQEDDLVALLGGAAEVLDDAGAVLVGGHTGEGAELAFGLSLTGCANPDRLMRRSGLRDGDALIVTKPLGTGVLLHSDMRARARGAWIVAALGAMQRPIGVDARILADHGARAAADITGFGLAGHLNEMLDASGVDAVLDLGAIPALDGAHELFAAGLESTLAPANRAAAAGVLEPAIGPGFDILFDPQTAGGLIAGISPDRAAACVAALRAAGAGEAAIIGHVVTRAGPGPRIAVQTTDSAV